jgi:hypothetical protein
MFSFMACPTVVAGRSSVVGHHASLIFSLVLSAVFVVESGTKNIFREFESGRRFGGGG